MFCSHLRPRDDWYPWELFLSNVILCMCIHVHMYTWWKDKRQIPKRISHGLNWENKTYNLKRSIIILEWRNEESWMRGQQTCPLTIHFNIWTVSSDVSKQRRHWQPLSVHLWPYCTHPTHDVNDVMSEGWPQHRGLRPLLFSNTDVGSFTSHKNQVSVSAVRRDLRFFVLIRED